MIGKKKKDKDFLTQQNFYPQLKQRLIMLLKKIKNEISDRLKSKVLQRKIDRAKTKMLSKKRLQQP